MGKVLLEKYEVHWSGDCLLSHDEMKETDMYAQVESVVFTQISLTSHYHTHTSVIFIRASN